MKKKLLIPVLLIFCKTITVAQDYRADLLKLLNKCSDSQQLISADMRFSYFSHHSATIPIDTLTSHIQLQGTNFYYSFGDHEYLNNDRCAITINNTDKLIILNKSKSPAVPLFSIRQLDSLLVNQSATVQELGISAQKKGYKIIFLSKEIESMELWFHLQNSLPAKVILFYGKSKYENEIHEPRVEIDYLNMRMKKSAVTASVFSEKKFLAQTGKDVKPGNAYRNYKVINNTL